MSDCLQVLQDAEHGKHFELNKINPSLQVSQELTDDLQSIQFLTEQGAQPDPLTA